MYSDYREVVVKEEDWLRVTERYLEADHVVFAPQSKKDIREQRPRRLGPQGKHVALFKQGLQEQQKELCKSKQLLQGYALGIHEPQWTGLSLRHSHETSFTRIGHLRRQGATGPVPLRVVEHCIVESASYHRVVAVGATAGQVKELAKPTGDPTAAQQLHQRVWGDEAGKGVEHKGYFVRLKLRRCRVKPEAQQAGLRLRQKEQRWKWEEGALEKLPQWTTVDCHVYSGTADFIISRDRYLKALRKRWKPNDECSVFYADNDNPAEGQWYPATVLCMKDTSDMFDPYRESPWEQLGVEYKDYEDEGITFVSAWELQSTSLAIEEAHQLATDLPEVLSDEDVISISDDSRRCGEGEEEEEEEEDAAFDGEVSSSSEDEDYGAEGASAAGRGGGRVERERRVVGTLRARPAGMADGRPAQRRRVEGPVGGAVQQVPEDNNENYCDMCLRGGDLVCCDGPCMRSFHVQCLPEEARPSGAEGARWDCMHCSQRMARCAVCGGFGLQGSQMHRCQVPSCGLHFHLQCLRGISQLDGHEEGVACTLGPAGTQGAVVACPAHFCQVCAAAPTLRKPVHRCWICPRGFHISCVEAQYRHLRMDPSQATKWEGANVECLSCRAALIVKRLQLPPNTDPPAAGRQLRAAALTALRCATDRALARAPGAAGAAAAPAAARQSGMSSGGSSSNLSGLALPSRDPRQRGGGVATTAASSLRDPRQRSSSSIPASTARDPRLGGAAISCLQPSTLPQPTPPVWRQGFLFHDAPPLPAPRASVISRPPFPIPTFPRGLDPHHLAALAVPNPSAPLPHPAAASTTNTPAPSAPTPPNHPHPNLHPELRPPTLHSKPLPQNTCLPQAPPSAPPHPPATNPLKPQPPLTTGTPNTNPTAASATVPTNPPSSHPPLLSTSAPSSTTPPPAASTSLSRHTPIPTPQLQPDPTAPAAPSQLSTSGSPPLPTPTNSQPPTSTSPPQPTQTTSQPPNTAPNPQFTPAAPTHHQPNPPPSHSQLPSIQLPSIIYPPEHSPPPTHSPTPHPQPPPTTSHTHLPPILVARPLNPMPTPPIVPLPAFAVPSKPHPTPPPPTLAWLHAQNAFPALPIPHPHPSPPNPVLHSTVVPSITTTTTTLTRPPLPAPHPHTPAPQRHPSPMPTAQPTLSTTLPPPTVPPHCAPPALTFITVPSAPPASQSTQSPPAVPSAAMAVLPSTVVTSRAAASDHAAPSDQAAPASQTLADVVDLT